MDEKFETATDEILNVPNDQSVEVKPAPTAHRRNFKKFFKYAVPALLVLSLGLNAVLLATPRHRYASVAVAENTVESRGPGKGRQHEERGSLSERRESENAEEQGNPSGRGN